MKKIVLGFIICFTAGVIQAQEPAPAVHRFTLEQCLDYALGNNYNRLSMKLTEEAKEDSYDQSKKERLPNLNASLGETLSSSKSNSSSWNGNYGVSAGVTLYQGGNISNTIEQNKLVMEQSKHQTSQYENELTVQVLQSFLSVLGNEELLKFQHAVLTASEEQLKQGKEQLRVKKILESDYLMLEAQYASDQNNIVDTEISRDNSLLTLKSLLSMDPEENLQIIYPDTTALQSMALLPQRDYAMEQAMTTMPDLKISQYNVDIAQVGIKLSKSGYLPTISLNGSVGTGHNYDYSAFGTQLSNNLNEQIGLSISIPIFDKGRTKSKVTQSKIALQQAEYDQKQTELNVRQTLMQEYQDVVSALSKFKASDVKQNAYLKTFEVYRHQFNAGAITAVDLLQQQNNYISALNEYIQSKYGFMLKRKILDVYMGEKISM